jgi:RNA polymerase sigma factor (sigma-70 family)
LSHEDAEDIASATFEVIFKNDLLNKWVSDRNAKLRTLLCAVSHNLISNHLRVNKGRKHLLRDHPDRFDQRFVLQDVNVPADQQDQFYAGWAADLIQQVLNQLMQEYHAKGRGDYFRVLHGKLCDRMPMREIAESLGISLSTAENYYKHVRQRLGILLESAIRHHVQRYAAPAEVADEFAAEWADLAKHLHDQGGVEAAIEKMWRVEEAEPFDSRRKSLNQAVSRLNSLLQIPPTRP